MAKFSRLEQQLKEKGEEHEETLYNMEKKAVIDNDK